MPKKSTFLKQEALYQIQRTSSKASDKEFSFDSIKKYIQNSPAYNDPFSRIIIENDTIYLGHNLREIQASFPKLPGLIMVANKPFNETNIHPFCGYGYKSADARMVTNHPLEEQQEKLKHEASEFFSRTPKTATITKKYHVKPSIDPSETLFDLIDNNKIIAVGEAHSDKASKKLLIDNMPQLKARGVEVIYLEHVFCDTQKEMIEAYFKSDSLAMPIMLANYLKSLDLGYGLLGNNGFSPYSFTGLVAQAKRCGIKIIPIDTNASYLTHTDSALEIYMGGKDPDGRCLMMNYGAAKKYHEEKPSYNKALFFVGSAHINAINSGVPGIAEITNGSTLVVQDKRRNEKEVPAQEHPAKPEVVVYMSTELSNEAIVLQASYEKDMALISYSIVDWEAMTSKIVAQPQGIIPFLMQYSGETESLLSFLKESFNRIELTKKSDFLRNISQLMVNYTEHEISHVMFEFLEDVAVINPGTMSKSVLDEMAKFHHSVHTPLFNVRDDIALLTHFGQQKHYLLVQHYINLLMHQDKQDPAYDKIKRASIEATVENQLQSTVGQWLFGIVSIIKRWWHYGFAGTKKPTGMIKFSDDKSDYNNPEEKVFYIQRPVLRNPVVAAQSTEVEGSLTIGQNTKPIIETSERRIPDEYHKLSLASGRFFGHGQQNQIKFSVQETPRFGH